MKEIKGAGRMRVIGYPGAMRDIARLPDVRTTEVDNFEWGSSQYYLAALLYRVLANEFEKWGDVGKTLAKLGIRVVHASLHRKDQWQTIRTAMRSPIIGCIATRKRDIEACDAMISGTRRKPPWIAHAANPEKKLRQLINKNRREITEANSWQKMPKTLTDVMHFCRKNSWDLWTAAPFAAKLGLILEVEAPDVLAMGYHGMMEVQGPNLKTAILCWLLHVYHKVPEEAFKEFDT
jgi:hypothetical protein